MVKHTQPHVIIHNETSLDSRIDWILPDLARYYRLAATFIEDATLVGSNTIISGLENTIQSDQEQGESKKNDVDLNRPILVVPDSRGRVKLWYQFELKPYWRALFVLCSYKTPRSYIEYLRDHEIEFFLAGEDHVNMRYALQMLYERFHINRIRVDSGGTLNSILLRENLVSEVSIILNPCLIGGISPKTFFKASDLTSFDNVIALRLIHIEPLDRNAVCLRYEVLPQDS